MEEAPSKTVARVSKTRVVLNGPETEYPSRPSAKKRLLIKELEVESLRGSPIKKKPRAKTMKTIVKASYQPIGLCKGGS